MKKIIKGSIDWRFFGEEPKDFDKAIPWYARFAEPKDHIEYLNTYIKKNKLNKVLNKRVDPSLGVIAHFLNTARAVPQDSINKLLKFVEALPSQEQFDAQREEKSKSAVQVITRKIIKDDDDDSEDEYEEVLVQPLREKNIQEKIQDQVEKYCGVIDGEIDKFLETYTSEFDIKGFAAGIKPLLAVKVSAFFSRLYNDVLMKDEDAAEAYSFMDKTQKAAYIAFLKNIISALDSRKENQKRSVVRKKKETPAYKKVERLKFMNMYKELNIMSIDPQKILGSTILICYNTKTKQLIQLVSEPGGFDVKGSTILNLNEKQCLKYKLRKPDETLKDLGNGKISITNTIKSIKTKPIAANGRINVDMLILRAI